MTQPLAATAYPHPDRPWTVRTGDDRWGRFEPETGTMTIVDPTRDPALPALEPAVDRGRLIGYRIGRRAIVATGSSYIKVVRPKRLNSLVATHRWMHRAGGGFATPRVIDSDTAGAVELSQVAGESLHSLLRRRAPGAEIERALEAVGRALASLHRLDPPSNHATAAPDDPQRWVRIVARAEPDMMSSYAHAASELPPITPAASAVIHRDLHDKNVFIDRSGEVSLIDLDGVGLGAPEDDVANLAVHLRLRAMQGGHASSVGQRWADTLTATYRSAGSFDPGRFGAVEQHTWFRLACLYRYRRAPLSPS